MPENINYAEKVLKKSQTLEAGPLLYCSVPNRHSISGNNLTSDPFCSRIPHCNLIPDFHNIPRIQGYEGQDIPIRSSKRAAQVQHHKHQNRCNTKGAKDLQEKCGFQGVHN